MTDSIDTQITDQETPSNFDEENRLTRDFVKSVSRAVGNDEHGLACELVEPLHAADIADLFELTHSEDRLPLAAALGDLMSADVLAELNDYVRDDLIELLPAGQVADLAGQLETDDAVAIIEDMDEYKLFILNKLSALSNIGNAQSQFVVKEVKQVSILS